MKNPSISVSAKRQLRNQVNKYLKEKITRDDHDILDDIITQVKQTN